MEVCKRYVAATQACAGAVVGGFGGINNLEDINDIIKNLAFDVVSMSRPFIIEPEIVDTFKDKSRLRSKCIMCNHCLVIAEEKSLKCYYGNVP